MSLLRALLLWAVMVAVPFQGHAAASMLGCAPGAPVASLATTWIAGMEQEQEQEQEQERAHRALAALDAHKAHKAHEAHEALSKHEAARALGAHLAHVSDSSRDAQPVHHGQGGHDAHHGEPAHAASHAHITATQSEHDHVSSSHDAPHTCGTCGTCHAVALIGVPALRTLGVVAPAHRAGAALPVATRALRVLDKPPRA